MQGEQKIGRRENIQFWTGYLDWRIRRGEGSQPKPCPGNPPEFMYVHIPKCAGTSLRTALGYSVDFNQHFTARRHRQIFGVERWNQMFTFTVIRNPWDHAVSWFYYARQNKEGGYEKYSFDEWLRSGLPHWWNRDWCGLGVPNDPMNQLLYIQDREGRDLVDRIYRFEELEKAVDSLSGQLGLEIALPFRNKSERPKYRHCYTPFTRELIAERYADFITRFGYSF